MQVKERLKRLLCYFLVIASMLYSMPVTAFAAEHNFSTVKDVSFSSDTDTIIIDLRYKARVNKDEYIEYLRNNAWDLDNIDLTSDNLKLCMYIGDDYNYDEVIGVVDESDPDYLIFDFTSYCDNYSISLVSSLSEYMWGDLVRVDSSDEKIGAVFGRYSTGLNSPNSTSNSNYSFSGCDNLDFNYIKNITPFETILSAYNGVIFDSVDNSTFSDGFFKVKVVDLDGNDITSSCKFLADRHATGSSGGAYGALILFDNTYNYYRLISYNSSGYSIKYHSDDYTLCDDDSCERDHDWSSMRCHNDFTQCYDWSCSENHNYFDSEVTFVFQASDNNNFPHIHRYGDPTFNWSEDYTSCTATFTCVDNDDSFDVPCDIYGDRRTCTTGFNGYLEAYVPTEYNGITLKNEWGGQYADYKSIDLPALGHIWSDDIDDYTLLGADDITQDLFDNAENSSDLDFRSLTSNSKVYRFDCDRAQDAYMLKVVNHTHTPGDAKREDEIPATCTQDGSYNLVVRCTDCNEILSSTPQTVDKLGHTWDTDDWIIINNPTQSLFEGADNSSSLSFSNLGSHDIVSRHECSRAHDAYQLKVDVHQHTDDDGNRENEVPADCTHDGSYDWVVRCTECRDIISSEHRTITKLGHTWKTDDWVVVSNPDSDLFVNADNSSSLNFNDLGAYDTVSRHECSRAQDAYQLKVTPHQHTNGDGKKENEIPATCTQDGSYNWVIRCIDCNTIISSQSHTLNKTDHTWGTTWQNVSSSVDKTALINGAENKDIILNNWVDDNYHRLQIQYCTNTWDCVRGSNEKAYRLRILSFDFKYSDDEDGDGKPDVVINVIEEPKEQGDSEQKIDELDTIIDEKPIVTPVNPNEDDPYVPYTVTPEDNPYDYDYEDERDYRIPTSTVSVSTNHWKEFVNTITFGIFFKDTQTGTISYEFKNPSEWDRVKTISYIVSKGGQVLDINEIKSSSNWTEGTSFTLEKEDVQKYIAYSKIRLACGYEFYISSNGMIMDSVPPTIKCQTEDDVILFSEEVITIEDNTKLDKVYVDDVEVSITLNESGNKTEIIVDNDNAEHTIKAVDKAGNISNKVIKFGQSDFIATVEGYIKDVDGNPIKGARVELHSTPRVTTTDETGKFSFSNVEVDRHSLTAFVNDEKIYDMSLALTPNYVQTELNDVKGTYSVSSDFTLDDSSIIVRVNADECANHVHGHVEKENEDTATCTKSGGYDSVDYCPNCGCEYSREYIFVEALGHIWDSNDWVLINNPTQELFDNAENSSTLDFSSLGNNDKVYKRLCHRAQDAYDIRVDTHSHTPDSEVKENEVPATCTVRGSYDSVIYCQDCHEELSREKKYVDALGHIWSDEEEWVFTSNPTEELFNNAENANELNFADLKSNDKVYKRLCHRAHDAYKLQVVDHVHTPDNGGKENEVSPKCTTNGSYDWVIRCNECNEVISSEHHTIDALGHIWEEDWQLISNPDAELFNGAENSDDLDFSKLGEYDKVYKRLCNRASDAYEVKVVQHTHSRGEAHKENEVSPTCTEKGSYDWVVRCSECNNIISSEHKVIDELGHIWMEEDWELVDSPLQELFDNADNSEDIDFSSLGQYDNVYKRLCDRASDAYEIKVIPHTHTPADGN